MNRIKDLPKTVTHISTGAKFKVLKMNLGGIVSIKCLDKGRMLIRKGEVIETDIDTIDSPDMLYVSPVNTPND